MKWKFAAASLAVAAIATAPIVAAAPGNDNGKKPVQPPGKVVSEIAKSGAGPVGVVGAVAGLKPNNTGLQNALERVTANHPSSTTPTP